METIQAFMSIFMPAVGYTGYCPAKQQITFLLFSSITFNNETLEKGYSYPNQKMNWNNQTP